MGSLGEFGAAKREADPNRERDTLSLCGVEFNVPDAIDPLAILEFGAAAASGLDSESPAGLAAIYALIRSSVEEEDWPRFQATVRRHRPPVQVLMDLCMAVIQRESGRPTVQPSGSSDGSSPTGESSRASFSSAVSSRPPTLIHQAFEDAVPISEAGLQLLAG
jgi:hypothetical protein